VKWTVEQLKGKPVRGIGNVLNFASYYEAFLAVVRRERTKWAERLRASQEEWQRGYVAQHGRVPTPDEVRQHYRTLEEQAIDASLDVFHDAMAHVSRNPDLTTGVPVGGRSVIDALVNRGAKLVSFEHAVDLVYHWLKHAGPGQTVEEYLREANAKLDEALREDRADVNPWKLVVKNHSLTLVVSIRDGTAYLTTFYYRD
jgi:hypothetical protein